MLHRLSSSLSHPSRSLLLGSPRLSTHYYHHLRVQRCVLRASSTSISKSQWVGGPVLRRYASSTAWGTDLNFPILDERPVDADGDQPKPPRLTVGQQPVGAVFGFTRMLTRMMKYLQKAEYCAVIFESPDAPSRRRDIISNYKANRTTPPPELMAQFHLMPTANEALNLQTVVASDCEAIDLIASYCKEALNNGHRVMIVGDDKDLLQLVGPNVTLYQPQKEELMGEAEVRAKYGVNPSQVPDLLALSGEKSDGIPGVPGITPKIAVGLLEQFYDLPTILSDLDSLENAKQRARLKEYSHRASEALRVTTLHDDLPLPVPLEDLKTIPIEKEKLMGFLQKYSFRSIENALNREYGMNFLNNEGLNPYGKPESGVYVPPVFDQQYEEGAVELEEGAEPEETELDLEFEQLATALPPLSDEQMRELTPEGITVVRNREHAKIIKEQLLTLTDRYHGIDTETHMIDLKKQSPVGNGFVMCVSIYCGPDVDFGNGPRLWIDNLDDCEGTLDEFKEYFENTEIKKVWHNYGFDRHVLYNHGIDVTGFGGDTMHMARLWDASRMNRGGYSLEGLSAELLSRRKVSMKDLFGHPKIRKDGTEGLEVILPPLPTLQRDPKYVRNFIRYSTYDAEATWLLRQELEKKLRGMTWNKGTTMWDFYNQLYLPFGDILTNMEREGIMVNRQYLAEIQVEAERDAELSCERFLNWAVKYSEEAKFMNPESDVQKQHLIYAPCYNRFTREEMPLTRQFEYENTEGVIEPGKTKARKKLKFSLNGLGTPPIATTLSGWPAVDSATMSVLAGNPKDGKYGKFYNHFVETLGKSEEEAKEACEALACLLDYNRVKTLMSSFIIPLQNLPDANGRVHTSVNINTETGRLSSRRPNLQNQPALEKDRYKIRKSFTCQPGNALVVADYGQLELRLLGHITKCKSMIDAFKTGGDFHSRTAIGMYPYIKEAVDNEWDKKDGEPPVPLLKDRYASERRKAKTLNFSIAYGKTAVGLARDWETTIEEANETLARWYADRPEVLQWQKDTIERARRTGYTRTLMGRYRRLPDILSARRELRSHSERAAINTPLQGGAADVVMKAMVLIDRDQRLREIGWRMLHQIHDELILEGPEESKDEALQITTNLMRNPLSRPLLVDLVVDARCAKTWYDAK